MNRILVDNDVNEFVKVKNKTAELKLDNNINLLIKNSNYNEYNFDISSGDINILSELESDTNKNFNFNIKSGNVVFNLIGYNNSDITINANLNDSNANIIINNSVIALNKEKIDVKINHNHSNTSSDVNNYGTTIKDGSIIFNCLTKVNKGKKNCLVNQNSKIITNNINNENRINPILLIDEYEVNAKHAAFIGNFNKEELFYLQSRGLSVKEATSLLLNGLLIGTLNINNGEKEQLTDKLKNDWR